MPLNPAESNLLASRTYSAFPPINEDQDGNHDVDEQTHKEGQTLPVPEDSPKDNATKTAVNEDPTTILSKMAPKDRMSYIQKICIENPQVEFFTSVPVQNTDTLQDVSSCDEVDAFIEAQSRAREALIKQEQACTGEKANNYSCCMYNTTGDLNDGTWSELTAMLYCQTKAKLD